MQHLCGKCSTMNERNWKRLRLKDLFTAQELADIEERATEMLAPPAKSADPKAEMRTHRPGDMIAMFVRDQLEEIRLVEWGDHPEEERLLREANEALAADRRAGLRLVELPEGEEPEPGKWYRH